MVNQDEFLLNDKQISRLFCPFLIDSHDFMPIFLSKTGDNDKNKAFFYH
jgi:hypothetical protein